MLGFSPLEVGVHMVDCLYSYLSLGAFSAPHLIPVRSLVIKHPCRWLYSYGKACEF